MKTGQRIPINVAKNIGTEYGYSQVVLHAYDGNTGVQHVTTWGKSVSDCDNAAEGGNAIKKLLKWESTDAVPNRVKRLNDEIILLKDAIQTLINVHSDKWTEGDKKYFNDLIKNKIK